MIVASLSVVTHDPASHNTGMFTMRYRSPNRCSFIRAVTPAMLLATSAATSRAQSLTGLGTLPGHTSSRAAAVNADGTIVVGSSSDGSFDRPIRWSMTDGLEDLGVVPGGQWAFASAISADGSTIVGVADKPSHDATVGFRWRRASGLQALNDLPDNLGSWVNGVNGNGTVIVGMGTVNLFPNGVPNQAVVWNNSTDPTIFPTVLHNGGSSITCSNGDGTILGGTTDTALVADGARRAALWINGAVSVVGTLPGTRLGAFSAISTDGKSAVGSCEDSFLPDIYGFTWTQAGGIVPLPREGNDYYVQPIGLSGDGSIAVGWLTQRDGTTYAFMHSTKTGLVPLRDYLVDLGVDVTGWDLTAATAISADGTTIVGEGTHNGVPEGFIANIGKDTDQDGLLDDWEINGIPYTDSAGTTQRYILDANGDGVNDANPLRKDVFVEVQSMPAVSPLVAFLNPVVEAFDRAPVPAPDAPGGLPGVGLHLQFTFNSAHSNFDDTWTQFHAFKAALRGSADEKASPERDRLLEAKARAYRFCMYGLRFGTSADDQRRGGIAEGIGCNDFMVTLFNWNLDDSTRYTPAEAEDISAGIFMHELGHALGLHHGGGDDSNYKPNYLSTMNYSWCIPDRNFVPNSIFRRFFPDYSDAVLPTLDENALIESDGVTPDPKDPDLLFQFSIPLGANNCDALQVCAASDEHKYCSRYTFFDAEVDWNNDCTFSTTPVAADINNIRDNFPSPGEVLKGFNDWANLQYDFKGTPYAADGPPPPGIPPISEPSLDDYLEQRNAWSRPACTDITMPPDTLLCPGQTATLTASPSGVGPFAFRWQALSHTGRLLATLDDGVFTDPVTGLSYTVEGSHTDTMSVHSVTLGRHPATIKFGTVATNSCGGTFSPATTVVVRVCAYADCPADYDGSGGTPDSTDIAAFFTGWLIGEDCADTDCSGGTPDTQDIARFFETWLASGC